MSWKSRVGMVLVVAALVATALSTAEAQRKGIGADFGDTGVDCGPPPEPGICIYSGYIETSKKCLPNRKVKMFALFMSGPPQLADIGRTSKNGGFGGLGITGNVSAAKFKLLKKEVGGVTCKGASFTGA